ncbi:MAG: methylmalonyl Co-A mutase-associated GTPase MeaB [Planctomycetota bacterium]
MSLASPSVDELVRGVRAGERSLVARAITLVESGREADRAGAHEVLSALLPENPASLRVGISGPPGVGKSTLIEALGLMLIDAGQRVGVLAVDPSSTVSGGSILGDKTRMNALAQADAAFVRPSPSAAHLGGVARRSREALLVLEAAGFDTLLVETVGVGQSETLVSEMTDHFVVLAQPGTGDELQGIKRGILELAEIVVVHKADGERMALARDAATQLSSALRIARGARSDWRVQSASSLEGTGLAELVAALRERDAARTQSGAKEARRRDQRAFWMQRAVRDEIERQLVARAGWAERVAELETRVRAGEEPPSAAREAVRRALDELR